MAKENDYSNIPNMGEVKKSQLDKSELFLIVNVEDKYRIALANHWVSKKEFNSAEEAQAYIDQKPWELIMNVAGVVSEFTIYEKKRIDEINK